LTEGTDGVVKDGISVASSVTGTAIGVGQGGGLDPLQVVGSAAGVLEYENKVNRNSNLHHNSENSRKFVPIQRQ
jgi:hypothetical protein